MRSHSTTHLVHSRIHPRVMPRKNNGIAFTHRASGDTQSFACFAQPMHARSAIHTRAAPPVCEKAVCYRVSAGMACA
jgi:hypothetical protein